MKNVLKYTLYSVILITLSYSTSAQCQSDECVNKLSDGYIFLKSYKMEQIGNDVEYSYVFSKDTNYMLVTCNNDGSSNHIVVTLMDSNKNVIATNYDSENDKYYPALAYKCSATGVYFLKYSFKQNPGCCISVLAFKK